MRKKELYQASLCEILRFAKSERVQIVFGLLTTIIRGLTLPVFSVLYGRFFLALSKNFVNDPHGGPRALIIQEVCLFVHCLHYIQ